MLKEPLPPLREKLNQSYVSSCSEDEISSHEDPTSSPDSSTHHHIPPSANESPIAIEIEPAEKASVEEVEVETAASSSSNALQAQIISLEEQLRSLTQAFQTMRNDESRATPTHNNNLRNQSPPPCDNLNLSRSSEPMLESESPPPADKEQSKILSLSCNGNGDDLAPAPDLEYRSYTPTYEEELRKLRKTSRGMSLDQSEASAHTTASAHSSTSNHEEEETNNEDPSNTFEKTGATPVKKKDKTHSILNDILAEGKDDKIALKINGKPPIKPNNQTPSTSSSGLLTKSLSNKNLASMTTSQGSKVETETTTTTPLAQFEEKMNTNAVVDFIRGLNIDSRQQDGSATEDVDVNMEEFLRVPFRIEKLLLFGLAVCFDCFLYVLTVTPLKFVWSLLCLACTIVRPGKGFGVCRFHRRHLYQLLRVFVIWFTYKYVLCPISLGRLYHWIRGQAMLKLYVLMAMVEVFDRLMCSFGQDALDSLYWNTTRRPYHPRMIASTIVVLVYAIIHSLILFVHAATLNVAMNSADSALMSLLIGGNFAEIKSTVFKKYNKQNLFKITTSDICERFKLVLFLGLVLLLNCTQGGMNQEMVNDYIYMSLIILGAEMFCDWIKHSFITKFNFIKSSVYQDYSLVLAGDLTGIGHEAMYIEHTHAVVKRLGFAQIPLVCVMLRYLREALRYADTLTHDGDSNHVLYSFAVVWTEGSWRIVSSYMLSFFLCLLGLKFLLGYAISRQARSIILYGPLDGHGESDPSPQRRQAV